MTRKLILILAVFLYLPAYSQQETEVRGNIIDRITGEPIPGATIRLSRNNQSAETDQKGGFYFEYVEAGEDMLMISSPEIFTQEMAIRILSVGPTILEDIKVMSTIYRENTVVTGIIEEAIMDEETDDFSQEISSTVILANDIYIDNANYRLSPFRFRIRGYTANFEQKYINGVAFNDQFRGVFNFASIGALNDLTRNGDVNNYHTAGTFTFGSIGGSENINMRAGSFGKGGKATVSYTNRNYYLRGMANYSTGMNENGWALTLGIGGRYSNEGNIEGTFYRNFSYAFSVEKQWEEGTHSLSFVTFGSPVERGQQGSSYQEAYDLVGNNLYNPNWGYQNGNKRNARVVRAYDPTGILSYIWEIDRNTILTLGGAGHYGRYGSTALNWYDGFDPRPDYYRYLPSYYSDNEDIFDYYTNLWKSKNSSVTQINWDELYRINELANITGDEAAVYLVEERRSDLVEGTFNASLRSRIYNNLELTAGLEGRVSESKQFKTIDDLMGAKYALDIDKFAERDFIGDKQVIQNDLNRPNRQVYEGDVFGYDFRLDIRSAALWILNEYSGRKIDFYYGTRLSYTDFRRRGKMRNGRYPDSSYGKGDIHCFTDYAFKAGFNYKVNGRNFITLNANYSTEAPLPYIAYISLRITDHTIEDLKSQEILSADINYIFSYPSVSGRISLFRTAFYNQMNRNSYYHDSERTFINHIIYNMDKVNQGIEIGLKYKIDSNWSLDFAGTLAEYYYNNNPDGIISYENGSKEDEYEKVYLKDYYVGSTPQVAATFGINYFLNYWFVSLNMNGIARNYIDIAPLKRVASNYQMTPGYGGINPNDPGDMDVYHQLTDQERFGSAFTIDFSLGKIFYLSGRKSVNFNFAVNNLLNRTTVKTGGYESGRLDLSYPDKFQSKYYYMQGINCFLNSSYRF